MVYALSMIFIIASLLEMVQGDFNKFVILAALSAAFSIAGAICDLSRSVDKLKENDLEDE